MIDTSNWENFRISELFEKLNLKCLKTDFNKSLDCSEVWTNEFSLPLTNAKHFNNGIQFYGRPQDWESAEMTIDIVSNGAIATGDVYAQPQRTGVLWDSYLIKCKYDIKSEVVLLYMACVIQKCIKQFFGWDDKCTWDKVKKQFIKLPVNKTNKPDWAYMESYMRKIIEESEQSLANLSRASTACIKIDTSCWKRFHLYDNFLFNIDMGTKLDKAKMKEMNPSVNFVGRANANNGITTRVDKIEGIEPYKAGYMTLSLGGEYLGSCFIQPDSFYTSQNVIVLIPKVNMTDNIKRFIATMIFKESRLYYKAFVDELNRHIKTDFEIYLPITVDDQPDWQYMESYMKGIIEKSEQTVKFLK